MFIKLGLLGFMLVFSTCGQTRAEGLDLNQAVLGCIMSGGDCLTNTGIDFIDDFFTRDNNVPHHNNEGFCRNYLGSWCCGLAGGYPSGYDNCREVKKMFYKNAKQKLNDWSEPSNWWKLEESLSKWGEPLFFTCNARQQYQWLKARCGKTEVYKKFWSKDWSLDEWTRIPTEQCQDSRWWR